jgi:hypothetical protein
VDCEKTHLPQTVSQIKLQNLKGLEFMVELQDKSNLIRFFERSVPKGMDPKNLGLLILSFQIQKSKKFQKNFLGGLSFVLQKTCPPLSASRIKLGPMDSTVIVVVGARSQFSEAV